jgi:hypothetical protein
MLFNEMLLTVWPDWANFRLLGDCLPTLCKHLFGNYRTSQMILATFSKVKVMHLGILTKTWLGHILLHFSQTHLVAQPPAQHCLTAKLMLIKISSKK